MSKEVDGNVKDVIPEVRKDVHIGGNRYSLTEPQLKTYYEIVNRINDAQKELQAFEHSLL